MILIIFLPKDNTHGYDAYYLVFNQELLLFLVFYS